MISRPRTVSLGAQLPMFAVTRLVVSTAFRMVYPFLPVLARGISMPLSTVALAISARSALGLAGPLFGSIADTRGRKIALRLGLLTFAAGMLVVAIWRSYWAFVAGLLLSGAGNILVDSTIYAYLGDQVPYERRGFAVAVTELGWSGAFVVGVPVIGWLIGRAGWDAPFFWLAALGLGAALAWQRILPPDTPRPESAPSLVGGLRRVGASRAALAGLAISLLIVTANQSINIIYGAWMETALGMNVEQVGAASAVIGLAGIGGLGLVALLADRLGKLRAITAGIAINALACLGLPLLGRWMPGTLASLFLFYLSFEFALVCTLSLLTELVPEARATLMSGSLAAIAAGDAMGALVGSFAYTTGLQVNAMIALVLDALALGMLALFVRGPRHL